MKPERFLSEHAEARLSGGIIWEVGFYVRNKIGENGEKRTKKDSTKTNLRIFSLLSRYYYLLMVYFPLSNPHAWYLY